MTAPVVTAAAPPPVGPKGARSAVSGVDTPAAAFGVLMDTLSASTQAAREAAQPQSPAIVDGALALGTANAADVGEIDPAEAAAGSETTPDTLMDAAPGWLTAPTPAATADDVGSSAAGAAADGSFSAKAPPMRLQAPAHPADFGADFGKGPALDTPQLAGAQIESGQADARLIGSPRLAALDLTPAQRPAANAARSALEAKPPQDPSPPVADLAGEAAAPTVDASGQAARASRERASDLAVPAQTAGAASHVAATQPRPGRLERTKAADEARSGKDASAVVGAASAGRRAAPVDTLTDLPPAPDVAIGGTRDDSAAPDVLSSPELATSAQGSAASSLATPLVRGSPETIANLTAQIVKKLEGRSTRFDVELDPAGLGKVAVRIEIGAHGHISAAMNFETPQAASELRARAGELRQALEQAGFNLSGGLSFDVAGDRGQARQDHQGAQQQAFRGQAFQAALETAGDAADAAIHGALRLRRGVTSSLDLRI